MDNEGYPTEDELRTISKWHYKDGYEELMNYIKERWAYADVGYWNQINRDYYLHTAGWSGNEELIHALRENFMFWSICWQKSERGGHYKFSLPNKK